MGSFPTGFYCNRLLSAPCHVFSVLVLHGRKQMTWQTKMENIFCVPYWPPTALIVWTLSPPREQMPHVRRNTCCAWSTCDWCSRPQPEVNSKFRDVLFFHTEGNCPFPFHTHGVNIIFREMQGAPLCWNFTMKHVVMVTETDIWRNPELAMAVLLWRCLFLWIDHMNFDARREKCGRQPGIQMNIQQNQIY